MNRQEEKSIGEDLEGMTFGERMKFLRHRIGLSVDQLSYRVQLTRGYLQRLERDRVPNPGLDTIDRVAKGLGVGVTVLVRGTEEPVNFPQWARGLPELTAEEHIVNVRQTVELLAEKEASAVAD